MKKYLTIFILLTGILFSNAVFASKAEIIVFCTNWNVKCRDAQQICRDISSQLGIKYTELDIDDPDTQQKAKQLGISYPSIPYIYYRDKNGNIVNGIPYKGESQQVLKNNLKITP